MVNAKSWTNDEVNEEIKRCIEEVCSDPFYQYVHQRLSELLKEYETSPKTPVNDESESSLDSDDDIKNTAKRRSTYWGEIEEDEN